MLEKEKTQTQNVKVEEPEMECNQCIVKDETDTQSQNEPEQKKPKISLTDSILSDDDDIEVTGSYTRSHREIATGELRLYRETPKAKNPLQFWHTHKYRLPHLACLASKYLVAQATSVAAERVFSTSGDILSAERACMDADALDCMIFLKKNSNKSSVFYSE